MQLNICQWEIIAAIVEDTAFMEEDVGLMEIVEIFGPNGKYAMAEGVDPVVGPARCELVHALRALATTVNRLPGAWVSDELLRKLIVAEDILEECEFSEWVD